MHRLLDSIDRIFARSHGKTGQLWKWARKHHPVRRFHGLVRFFGQHQRWNRLHRRVKRARWFGVKKTIYRRKLRKLRAHHKPGGSEPAFQPFMANGCPIAGVDQSVLDYIARQVVWYGSFCTATTNGVHAPNSWHYQGKAGDTAGSKMSDGQIEEYEKHQAGTLELFGPDNGHWLKNGAHMSIADGDPLETQHDNHVHRASA